MFELLKVFVVESIGEGNHICVEPLVTGPIASDQKDRSPARIEREERSERSTAVLGAKLLHIGVFRAGDGVDMWTAEVRPIDRKELDAKSDGVLLLFAEGFPPLSELLGIFDVPRHNSITYTLYCQLWD